MVNIKPVDKMLVYPQPRITTPFRRVKVIFADDTASGRPSPIVDKSIQRDILPYYSNTHSNAYCGIRMKKVISRVKGIIRKEFNLTKKQNIIFKGYGATACSNHLVRSIDTSKYESVKIVISQLEHHSNFLPWQELSTRDPKVSLEIVSIEEDWDINYTELEDIIKKVSSTNTLTIVSLTACSNVTGIKTNLNKVRRIVDMYPQTKLVADYACSAPYVNIDGSILDAFFLSFHKFLGGQSAPGLLVANSEFFRNKPISPGGGCVSNASLSRIEYSKDLERRESAGTPNIVGIARIGYILDLRRSMFSTILYNEEVITKYLHSEFTKLTKNNSNLKVIGLNINVENRLPIISFTISNLHYNLVVVLLNDLFGIQSRGGVSCCGILADHIQREIGTKGWCRITFSWLMDKNTIDTIIKGIDFICKNGYIFKKRYSYNSDKNLFTFRRSSS